VTENEILNSLKYLKYHLIVFNKIKFKNKFEIKKLKV
jgi:hypothetical protein